jgi:hypothetical protein
MKYELTEKINGLYRIRALKDFSNVKAGYFGGFVASERNLSQTGDAWVYDNAQVYGYAVVHDNAKVYHGARVSDNAQLFDNAQVYGDAIVYGNVRVYGDAWVYKGRLG